MRYVVKHQPTTGDFWSDDPLLPNLTVDGPKEVNTRLVDRFGNKIVRIQPPIGFGRDEEW